MPARGNLKDGENPGKATAGLLDLDLDVGVVEIFIDSDDCLDDDCMEPSTSFGVFSSPHDVFVVRKLSKAVAGFRPAVTCEGFLAHVSRTSSGYTLLPRGSDQQLSFKYEPPSPKFSGSRPGCISYRLQLLHGSQFLYSLRGLPKSLRCQRSAHALEWGPVHLVFAAASDLDTFLATLKYVEVEEMAPPGEAAEGQLQGGRGAQADTPTRQHYSGAGSAGAGTACGGGAVGRGAAASCGGCGAPWPSAAAKLWKDGNRGHGTTTMASAAAGGSCGCRSHSAPMFAATAGTAMLAAVAAACLLNQRGGGGVPGRKRIADSPVKVAA
ncbi:hypothetical protein PLESTB_001307900 [Pleodorina starrii]|uniref:Uncharacterized protein n=1 Tax=Pleodorina starrii TaxID=330485 RepID=A0A9W6F6Y7_9CHLO|nr:hypothetical protein PLESTM_002047700 [Pleodorina starrii]GLC58006.1 hypothetical protein PLESTB_001307900 [Pleodorina starrii]GLC69601.1 hypothetical protein PLESTF_000853000 [Pleodorina starrii]